MTQVKIPIFTLELHKYLSQKQFVLLYKISTKNKREKSLIKIKPKTFDVNMAIRKHRDHTALHLPSSKFEPLEGSLSLSMSTLVLFELS